MHRFLLALICLIGTSLDAQQWRKFDGPYAGSFATIVVSKIDPQLMFAVDGNAYALYRSTDGGDHWNAVREPFQTDPYGAVDVKGVALDAVSANTVYAVAYSSHYISTDRGDTWTEGDYSSQSITLFVSHPSRARTIFAGGYGGLYRTTTGGLNAASWDTVLRKNVANISFSTVHPDTMFAATTTGAYRSLDAGATWTSWPAALATHSVYDLHEDVADAQRFYATLCDTIMVSTDGGTTWTQTATRINGGKLEQAPGDPSRMYVWGSSWLYRSTDRGATWATIESRYTNRQSITFHPTDSHVIFSGSWNDVPVKSTDGGTTWVEHAQGLSAATVSEIYPATASIWYLNAVNRVFKTTDAGATWIGCANNVDSNVPSGGRFYSLAVDPANPNILHCGNNYMMYKSTDGAASWTAQSTTVSYSPIYSIAIDPSNSNNIYYGGMGTLRYSTNGGTTVRSYSGNGLPNSAYGIAWAISPANPDRMIVADNVSKVFVTDNKGASWTSVSIPEDFTSIRFHPDSERVAYASGSGAYRTSDGGLTWNELANSPYTYDVLIDPVHPSVIYAAVHGKPFVVSTSNLGVTWDTLAPRGLGSAAAATLAMTPQTNMLLTGGDGGLWWFDPTPVGVREPAQPATISLAQNAPNPAVDATTISFTMAQRGEVDLRVYDMLGREIAAPLRASLSAGEHHAVVRTSSLRVGTYAYVLRVNGSTMTRTMIVAR